MKRIFLLIASFITAFSLCACQGVDEEKQAAIMQYINGSLTEAAAIETDMLESYYSVTGDNFVDDYTAYTEFSATTVEFAKDLAEKAEEIGESISDEEILAVHSHYENYAKNYLSYIENMVSAIEFIDSLKVEEAEEKMAEASKNYEDVSSSLTEFNNSLNALAEKYELSLDYQN